MYFGIFFSQPLTVELIQIVAAKRISLSELPSACKDVFDIDADHEDPQFCSEYAVDIYNNLHVYQVCHKNIPFA